MTMEGDGFSTVSGFVVRRALALCYCSAFLSLIAQVDGLFGCEGVSPPKAKGFFSSLPYGGTPVILMLTSVAGSLLSGVTFIGVKFCERHAVMIFLTLWVFFLSCVHLAPQFYPLLEDKLILETGFVALFLVGQHQGATLRHVARVGRVLAAWLLFRFVYVGAVEKVTGTCDAWRSLTALRDLYQLEPFPLPPAYALSQLLPLPVACALTAWQLYVQLLLLPLVLAPWRVMAVSATSSQLFLMIAQSAFANQGCKCIALAALAFAALDDSWHEATWGEKLLRGWGCYAPLYEEKHNGNKVKEQEEEEEEEEEEESEEEEAEKEAEDAKASEDSTDAMSWGILLIFFVGYVASLVLTLRSEPDEATLAERRRVAQSVTVGIAFCASASAAALLALTPVGTRDAGGGPGLLLRVALAVLGLTVWGAGLLQLSRDFDLSAQLPQPLSASASALERAHLFHAFGAAAPGEVRVCPSEKGRADISIRGAALAQQFDEEHTKTLGNLDEFDPRQGVQWLTLSSRFLTLLGGEEKRPVWVQPYTPRLDYELWRLAQRGEKKAKKANEKWLNRLTMALAFREGAAASLSAGSNSWTARLEAFNPKVVRSLTYGNMKPPVARLTMNWYQMRFVDDIHQIKWWRNTEASNLKEIDRDDLIKMHKKWKKTCSPTPWADWPIAEALATLLGAAFLWSVLVKMLLK